MSFRFPLFVFASLLSLSRLASPSFAVETPAAAPRVMAASYGVDSSGRNFTTKELQKAIDDLAAKGGGTLVLQEGAYLSGALFLKPGVNLHLEKNAVLRGSTNIEDYPKMPTRIEGHTEVYRPALLNVTHGQHVEITGEGILDGSGAPYWQTFWTRRAADKKTKNLDVERPRLLFIGDSSDVHLQGLTLKDSGFWNLHLYRCQRVVIEDLHITAPFGAPSSDGIDVDSCQEVLIRRCTINVDDDCIALKGSKGPDALEDKDSPPVDHIRVEDCTFTQGGAALTLGSEATIVRNVSVEHCRVISPKAPRRMHVLRIKLRPDTPQLYENISVHDIAIEGPGTILLVSTWTQYFDLQGKPAPESTVRNVNVSGIHGHFEGMGSVRVHDKAHLRDFHFEDWDVTLRDTHLDLGPVENLSSTRIIANGKQIELKVP